MNQELKNAFDAVISMLPQQFDSHDFIKKFMQYHPVAYAETIIKCKSIPASHGHIALTVSNNSNTLGVKSMGRRMSIDIFNEMTECELWIKTNDNDK